MRKRSLDSITGFGLLGQLLAHDFTSLVNMYVGTSFSFNVSDVHDYGNAMLSVGYPHAHTPWTPQTRFTENKCESPYYYFDDYWRGLRRTHWMSGSCVIDYGTASVLPTSKLSIKESLFFYRLNHSHEVVMPHYYSVRLQESSLYLEASSKDSAGMLRLSQSETSTSSKLYILFMGSDTIYNQSSVEIISDDTVRVTSPVHRWYQAKGESAGFSGYHHFKTSRPAETFGIISGLNELVQEGATRGSSGSEGIVAAYLQFNLHEGPVTIATGSSFLSGEKAEENMLAELESSSVPPSKSGSVATSRGYMRGRITSSTDESTLFDLEKLANDVKAEWNKKLAAISVNLGQEHGNDLVHDIPINAGMEHNRHFENERSPPSAVGSATAEDSIGFNDETSSDATISDSTIPKKSENAASLDLNSVQGSHSSHNDFSSLLSKAADLRASTKQHFNELQTTFYSALWHALLLPRVVNDHDGAYLSFGFDSKPNSIDGEPEVQRTIKYTHDASNTIQFRRYFDDFSMWDTFRAHMPLLLLISDRSDIRDMIASLVVKTQQGGWLPIFPAWNSYTAEMIGDHCSVFIADAIFKGILAEDDPLIEPAMDAILRNALTQAPDDEYKLGKGRRAMESYLRLGYIPIEDEILDSPHPRQQVSRSLEYYYDDFVVSQLVAFLSSTHGKYRCLQSLSTALQLEATATQLSEASVSANLDESCIEVADSLLRRSKNYGHAIDAEGTGFIRPKHENGSWALNETEFDPAGYYPWITETTAWQYTWFVPHDVEGMIKLYGGAAKFFAKLDRFFDEGWYNHGNEPDHHALYLYAFLEGGAPILQKRLVDIVRTQYGATEKGLAGNEDAGQMSAWLVMSALGLYPVCPGCGGHNEYALGAPLFDNITMHLAPSDQFEARKSLKVIVTGREEPMKDVYVQQLFINGKEYDCGFVSHETLTGGGVWTYVMGSAANATRAKSGRACLNS